MAASSSLGLVGQKYMSDITPSLNQNVTSSLEDLEQNRLSTRHSWRQAIAQSGLPKEVQVLIRSVVRKSRLMRFEKIEVVLELIAHFLDGQHSGKSYPQLINKFGDPQVAAALIRRSKIRNRPIMMKFLNVSAWVTLPFILFYLIVLSWFHMGQPQPTTDFLADLNRSSLEGGEDEKAWPIYRPLWIKHGFSEGGGINLDAVFHQEGEDRHSRLARPGDPEWQLAIDKLDELGGLLDAFRRGSSRPLLGLELQADFTRYSNADFQALFPHLDYEQELAKRRNDEANRNKNAEEVMDGLIIGALLPHIQSFRRAARLFHVDTRRAVQQNDPDRAVENIETMFGLAEQASDSNILVCSLVGMAVCDIAFDVIEEVVVEEPNFLHEKHLARLQAKLENLSIREWVALQGERAMMYDIFQRIYTDDGNGDGRITPIGVTLMTDYLNGMVGDRLRLEDEYPGFRNVIPIARKVAAPMSLFVVAGRKETAETYDRFMDAYERDLDTPAWEEVRTEAELDDFLQQNPNRFNVLEMLFPAMEQIRRSMNRIEGRKEGVIAALAVNRYQLKYDHWPESFDQVAPEFVIEFPVDQMNGKFVGFRLDENGPLIYSVGNDGDDDGGQLVVGGDSPQRPIPSFYSDEGDWILWPQSDH